MTFSRIGTFLLLYAAALPGQRIIYDASRDKTAQDAVTAVKGVTGGELFAKMLRNVDLQTKKEVELTFTFEEQQMRSKLENFRVWSDSAKDRASSVLPGGAGILKGRCYSLVCELQALQFKIDFLLQSAPLTADQIKTQLNDLKSKKNALDEALKGLKSTSNKDPGVVHAFDLLNENGKNSTDYGEKITKLVDSKGQPTKGLNEALTELGKGLDQMVGLYNAVKSFWAANQAVQVEPISLRPPQQKIDLQLLALESDHLELLAKIKAEECTQSGVTLDHVESALKKLSDLGVISSQATVEWDLKAAAVQHDRARLTRLLDALYEAAAAVAEGDAAGIVAELRSSEEEHRYSIRRAAVNASTYDQTIQLASQRLALYWKSGIKPAEVAQLIFYLTSSVAVPVIAAK